MSIQSEIVRLNTAKTAISDAIEEKGVEVPDGTSISGMAEYINEIPSGAMNRNNPEGAGTFNMNRKANTTAGAYSSTIGVLNEASGEESFAEGFQTKASGNYSHAEGYGTIASGTSQHVEGEYNIEDTEDKYYHIVGNGTTTERSNAYTLDKQGNACFAGDIQTVSGKVKLGNYILAIDENGNLTVNGGQIGSLFIYKAKFAVDGWTASDGTYTQTATVSSVDGGPAINDSTFLSAGYTERTDVVATNETLAQALSVINTGVLTVSNGSVTVSGITEKLTCDINVYWFGKTI